MKTTSSLSDITDWFFKTLLSLLESQAKVTIGLGGGSSFDSWYVELLSSSEWKNIDMQRIRWCVTDERINCEIKDRNDERIWTTFFLPLMSQIKGSVTFIRPVMGGIEYSEKVGNIDIGFFGIGADGHTASLFPRHPALSTQDLGFITIDNAPKPPPERISLSPASIQALKHVCLFVVGETKKEALANFFDDTVDIKDCPAKLLKPDIILDLVG